MFASHVSGTSNVENSTDTTKDHCFDDTKLKIGSALRYTLLAVLALYKVKTIVLKINSNPKCSYYNDCLSKHPRYTNSIHCYYSETVSNGSWYHRLLSLALCIFYG